MKYTAVKNFIPTAQGYIGTRIGMQPIPYKRRGFISRIKSWWAGNPCNVNSMITYDGFLFVATDKGLYIYKNGELVSVQVGEIGK